MGITPDPGLRLTPVGVLRLQRLCHVNNITQPTQVPYTTVSTVFLPNLQVAISKWALKAAMLLLYVRWPWKKELLGMVRLSASCPFIKTTRILLEYR